MSTSSLQQLPQELRDAIYHFVLARDDTEDQCRLIPQECSSRRLATKYDRWQWSVLYPTQCPLTDYYNLLRTSRQCAADIQTVLADSQLTEIHPASLTLLLNYPSITPTWIYLSPAPNLTQTLDLTVKIDQMYHPAFVSRPPYNAILLSVFEILKQYIHNGPHFARRTPLTEPLHLETVRITIAPPQPLEEMTYLYGFPAQQLANLYQDFRGYAVSFAKSGVPFGSFGALEVRLDGGEFERVPVTAEIWDEQDYLFFRDGGYRWGSGSD